MSKAVADLHLVRYMNTAPTQFSADLLYCISGVLVGYLGFSLLSFWSYGGFWANAGLALALHSPVFAVYIALLLFARRHWPRFLSRAGLVVCGIGVGLFPVLGWFPGYSLRLGIAVIVLGIQLLSVVVLGSATYVLLRVTRRLHET